MNHNGRIESEAWKKWMVLRWYVFEINKSKQTYKISWIEGVKHWQGIKKQLNQSHDRIRLKSIFLLGRQQRQVESDNKNYV